MRTQNWWQGRRGEWYVAGQAAIILLLLLGPRAWPGAPAWAAPYSWLGQLCGGLLLLLGVALSLLAALHLGSNLTPLPHPKDGSQLIVHGTYRIVRHPIYSGLILAAFGWALCINGWLTLGYALLLFLFFDIKSRREEAWLMGKFPEYRHYRQQVRKLIPFIY